MREKAGNRFLFFWSFTILFLMSFSPAFGQSREASNPVIEEAVFGLEAIAAADRLTAGVRRDPRLIPLRATVPAVTKPREQSSGWDELAEAREKVRRALDESTREMETQRSVPVNMPNHPASLSPVLQSELSQVSRGFQNLVPQRPRLVAPEGQSLGALLANPPDPDPMDDELRAFERSISAIESEGEDRRARVLAPARVEGISSRYTPPSPSVDEDGIPLLAPKQIARERKTLARPVRKLPRYVSATNFASSARGSTRDSSNRIEDDRIAPSQTRRAPQEILPSKARGKNVRIVDAFGEEE